MARRGGRVLELADRLDHRPSELSGGQQQRVAVARALVGRPEIVFADEPSGNLDTRSGGQLLGFLRSAVDGFGQTVVMVTHDASAASYADRVLFLSDGRVVDDLPGPTVESVLDRIKLARRLMWRAALKGALGHRARLVISGSGGGLLGGLRGGDTGVHRHAEHARSRRIFEDSFAGFDIQVRSEIDPELTFSIPAPLDASIARRRPDGGGRRQAQGSVTGFLPCVAPTASRSSRPGPRSFA
jgi:energy-coupling factor transporter ATP-binding protein EcfA2